MGEEKNFEKVVRNYLSSVGGWSVKFFANSYTTRGIPDLLCCVNGKFLAIEVKATNGRPSKLQETTIEQIKKAGGYGIILYPQNFEDFKRCIENEIIAEQK